MRDSGDLGDLGDRGSGAVQLEERLTAVGARLIANLAAALSQVPTEQIEAQVEVALRRLQEFLGADRVTLCELRDGALSARLSWPVARWRDESLTVDIPPEGWLAIQVATRATLVFSRLAEVPVEATSLRAALQRRQTVAMVAVPVSVAGRLRGYLVAESKRAIRPFVSPPVTHLAAIAPMLAAALERGVYQRQQWIQVEAAREQVAHQRRLLTSFIDDVRSALTAMIGYAELGDNRLRALPDARGLGRSLRASAHAVSARVEQLATLVWLGRQHAEAEPGAAPELAQQMDVTDVARESVRVAERWASAVGVSVVCGAPAGVAAIVSVRTAIRDLLANAMIAVAAASEPGGSVTVTVAPESERCRVEVATRRAQPSLPPPLDRLAVEFAAECAVGEGAGSEDDAFAVPLERPADELIASWGLCVAVLLALAAFVEAGIQFAVEPSESDYQLRLSLRLPNG